MDDSDVDGVVDGVDIGVDEIVITGTDVVDDGAFGEAVT